MEYKLSPSRHGWIIFQELFLFLATCLIIPLCYIYYNIEEKEVFETFYISLAVSIFFFTPLLILHLNYYFACRNKVIFVDYDSQKIEITENGSVKYYSFNDIKMILIIKSYNNRLAWSNYGYMKIGFKDDNVIVITTLMTDLDKLNFENTNTFKELYPYCN